MGKYNILDGHGLRLSQAIRAVERGNYELMLLMEKNISDEVYCRNRLGYGIV